MRRLFVRLFMLAAALALLLLPLLLTGCSNLPKVAKELKDDQATVVVNVNTIYGTARLVRTNPGTNHSATISPDGTVRVERIQGK